MPQPFHGRRNPNCQNRSASAPQHVLLSSKVIKTKTYVAHDGSSKYWHVRVELVLVASLVRCTTWVSKTGLHAVADITVYRCELEIRQLQEPFMAAFGINVFSSCALSRHQWRGHFLGRYKVDLTSRMHEIGGAIYVV